MDKPTVQPDVAYVSKVRGVEYMERPALDISVQTQFCGV